jgi:hypothetical protein
MPGDHASHLVATTFTASLPMNLYLAPILTNELFAAFVIALAIHALVIVMRDESGDLARAAAAGALAGAAMLSKFTAVLSIGAGAVVLCLRKPRREASTWAVVAVYAVVSALSSGWFYRRNVLEYGTPFIGNWDDASSFAYVQEPSFRTLGFFGGVFFQHPTRSVWTSWLDGMYATVWADSHSVLIDQSSESAFFWMGALLIVAFFPTVVIAIGFASTVVRAVRDERDDGSMLLVLVCAWTWLALIWFTLKVPAYSTVKAFFFLSLAPTLGVFLARGRRALSTHLPSARFTLDGAIVIATCLSFWIYRVQ